MAGGSAFPRATSRGGYVRDVHIRNVDSPAWVQYPFDVTYQYSGGTGGDLFAEVDGLFARGWRVDPCGIPYRIRAAVAAPAGQVELTNLAFARADNPPLVQNTRDLVLRRVTIAGEPAT
ncbi:hypothetical protein [Actinopolymorpha alba]|uniref:hypothetical protein n=1 Tax=Actinopolymorpha alba TaxID=533267 RepID=UPI00039DAB4F|nr:hypothetical protein [Actinopolymorpha alba]